MEFVSIASDNPSKNQSAFKNAKSNTFLRLIYRPRFFQLKAVLFHLAALFFAGNCSKAQSPSNSLLIESTATNLHLNYSFANTNGSFLLLQNDQLDNLLSAGQVIASGIVASNPIGTIIANLTNNGMSFWSLLVDPSGPVTPADLTPSQDGDESPDDPSAIFIESPHLPTSLPANAPFLLTLHINDIKGHLIDTNGTITLSLVVADGTPLGFSYILQPSVVVVSNGTAQTTLTIQTTNSLAGAFLNGAFIARPSFPSPLYSFLSLATIGLENVPWADYADPDTNNWQYPLASVYPLSGGFGEYPGHKDIHWGIDLAAPEGTKVVAAKQGIVVRIGSVCGRQIVDIYHGNGYLTRYMHINPLVKEHNVVNKGDVIGTVGNFSCVGVHLHFEIRQLTNPDLYNSDYNYTLLGPAESVSLSLPVNPINPNFRFFPSLVSSGGFIPSLIVPAVYIRSCHPALKKVLMDPAQPTAEPLSSKTKPQAAYVVIQAVLQNAGHFLTPQQIIFTPDSGPAQQIIYGLTEQSIKLLDPRDATNASDLDGPGYTLLTNPETNALRSLRYKYWFQWDTSQYATPSVGPGLPGPHSFTVRCYDVAGDSTLSTFEFGPQVITNGQPFFVSSKGSPFTLPINFKFGPLPNAGISGSKLDICKCSISVTPASDWQVQFLPGSGQSSPASSLLNFDVTGHNITTPVTLQVSPKVSQPTNGALILMAESFVLPGVHDQVTIPIRPSPFGAVISSVFDFVEDSIGFGGLTFVTNVTVMATNTPTLMLAESGIFSQVNGSANYEVNNGGNIFHGSLLADGNHGSVNAYDYSAQMGNSFLSGSFNISVPSKILVSGSLTLTAGDPSDVNGSGSNVRVFGAYENQSVQFVIVSSEPGITNFNASLDAPAGSYFFDAAANSTPRAAQNYTNAAMVHVANQFSITITRQ